MSALSTPAVPAAAPLPPPPQRVWVPVDVKTAWLRYLDTRDLAAAAQVCRSWHGLVARTVDAEIARTTGAPAPPLCGPAKAQLLHRLRRPLAPRNYGYLLAWAAGSRGEWAASGGRGVGHCV